MMNYSTEMEYGLNSFFGHHKGNDITKQTVQSGQGYQYGPEGTLSVKVYLLPMILLHWRMATRKMGNLVKKCCSESREV